MGISLVKDVDAYLVSNSSAASTARAGKCLLWNGSKVMVSALVSVLWLCRLSLLFQPALSDFHQTKWSLWIPLGW